VNELTVFSNQNVFRLQVSVDNLVLVEMAQRKGNLRSEETHVVLGEALDLHEMTEKLSALNELHQEVNSVLVLEDVLHVDQEGVVNGVKNVLFKTDVL